MRRTILRAAASTALATALVAGTAGIASADPVHILFQTPAVTGPNIGPTMTPAGMFPLVTVTAEGGEGPGTATFSVPHPEPYYYMFGTRFVVVHWQNLHTGATGDVPLRYWQSLEESGGTPNLPPEFPETLPTSTTVETGVGPVVATVTHHRTEYNAPPAQDGLIPGTAVFVA